MSFSGRHLRRAGTPRVGDNRGFSPVLWSAVMSAWIGLAPLTSLADSTAPNAPPPATNPAAAAPATTAPATTAPATHPATEPAFNQATPRDALKFFAAALRDGDAQRLRKAVLTHGEGEDSMVVAIADMAIALRTLHQAAVEAFGPEAAGRFTEDTTAGFDQTVARIDAAEVSVDADTAIVRYPDSKDNPYELKRVGEDWKVPATQFTHGATAEVLSRRIVELNRQAGIVRELKNEIAAGKHKSAEAAGLAWRSKMMAALSGDGPKPATAPASQSTTKPKG